MTWFPAPALNSGRSGAAATVDSVGRDLLLGGTLNETDGVLALGAASSAWTSLPPIDAIRIGPGAVAGPGGTVLVFGGDEDGTVVDSVISYNPSSGAILNLAAMSTNRCNFAYTADATGAAYAIGGQDDNGTTLSSVERYDPVANAWTALSNLPAARRLFPAVFDGTNFIYTFGGRSGSANSSTMVLRYDITAGTWTAMAPMPVATSGSGAAWGADGNIYVIGGQSAGVTTNLVQVYNPGANAWAISTPLPAAVTALCSAVDSLGRLIVMGGTGTDGLPGTNVWRSQQLGVPDSTPGVVLTPSAKATYQVPYLSSITATGNPQPTYVLLSGPAGMQVDNYSGAITWTPQLDQIGTNQVSIRATNDVGYADDNFAITVIGPTPPAPTGLAQIGATDTSVTLGWVAPPILVGTPSYDVYVWHVVHPPRGSSYGYYVLAASGITDTTATLGGSPGTAHIYAVTVTAAGASSGYSSPAGATTTSPQPPQNLRVTGLTSTTLSLAWDPAPGPDQNSLYSSIASYSVEKLPSTITVVSGITGTVATVTGLASGSGSYWTVKAIDVEGFASAGNPLVAVTNPAPVVTTLSGAARLPDGTFQFTVSGAANQTALVEATTDLTDPMGWAVILSFMPPTGIFSITDTNAGQFRKRFYRVTEP